MDRVATLQQPARKPPRLLQQREHLGRPAKHPPSPRRRPLRQKISEKPSGSHAFWGLHWLAIVMNWLGGVFKGIKGVKVFNVLIETCKSDRTGVILQYWAIKCFRTCIKMIWGWYEQNNGLKEANLIGKGDVDFALSRVPFQTLEKHENKVVQVPEKRR